MGEKKIKKVLGEAIGCLLETFTFSNIFLTLLHSSLSLLSKVLRNSFLLSSSTIKLSFSKFHFKIYHFSQVLLPSSIKNKSFSVLNIDGGGGIVLNCSFDVLCNCNFIGFHDGWTGRWLGSTNGTLICKGECGAPSWCAIRLNVVLISTAPWSLLCKTLRHSEFSNEYLF